MNRIRQSLLLFMVAALCVNSVQAQAPVYKYKFTVAKDGSGDYRYIQDAIDAMRVFPLARITLYIKNGVYNEKIELPATNTDVSFIGESVDSTIIVFNDYSGRGRLTTFTSWTARISGNRFVAENITFSNSAGPVGQAVALHVDADSAVFRNCRFLGNQDTIYAGGETSRQYFENCYIEGTTDFIFGPAAVFFRRCRIRCKANSYVTAASTRREQKFGFVFLDCTLKADSSVSKLYLGRPWRGNAKTVFVRCELPAAITPAGWDNWGNKDNERSSFYAEYGNYGPGADLSRRAGWSHRLTEGEAAEYIREVEKWGVAEPGRVGMGVGVDLGVGVGMGRGVGVDREAGVGRGVGADMGRGAGAAMARTVMTLWKDSFSLAGQPVRWSYDMGVILKGMEGLWRNTGDSAYFRYIRKQMDYFIREDGSVRGYFPAEFNLDYVNNGKCALFLYKTTGEKKYKMAADLLRQQLYRQPRTSEGGFWHKKVYVEQMWLDGLYMASPFYAEYTALTTEDSAFRDVTRQFVLMEQHARDKRTGLLYHGWNETRQERWADKASGHSPLFWGRAMGWYASALVDALDWYPEKDPGRGKLIAILQRLAAAIAKQQDGETGLWKDILAYDGPEKERNYFEASASCQFVYALAKGVRKGYLAPQNGAAARKGYEGILKRFISNENGRADLLGTVKVSGLGGNPYRDGSFGYYMSEPVIVNDPKGMGAFILAAGEMER